MHGVNVYDAVERIREKAYTRFFFGFAGHSSKAPSDPSMVVHYRKRFSEEDLNQINIFIAVPGKSVAMEAVE